MSTMKMLALASVVGVALGAHETRCGEYCDIYLGGDDCNGATATAEGNELTAATYTGDDAAAIKQACIDQCAAFPEPFTQDNSVTSGNSYACRFYHANVGASEADDIHCTHGSPISGQNVCVDEDPAVATTAACEDYCNNWDLFCGEYLYADKAGCVATCSKLDAGVPTGVYDLAGPTSGANTACKRYHIDVAAGHPRDPDASTNDNLDIHCPHATYGAGQCGSTCENFCAVNIATCAGDNEQYADNAACITACEDFTVAGTKQETGSDSLECRFYHLTVAATTAENADVHCPHTAVESDPCAAAVSPTDEPSSASAVAPAFAAFATVIAAAQL